MYYTYILRCEDNSLYTGIATDLQRRFEEHLSQEKGICAKYTLSHKAKKLESAWESKDKVLASKLEYRIKNNLTKSQKENLIKNNYKLTDYFGDILECSEYTSVDVINLNKNQGGKNNE